MRLYYFIMADVLTNENLILRIKIFVFTLHVRLLCHNKRWAVTWKIFAYFKKM